MDQRFTTLRSRDGAGERVTGDSAATAKPAARVSRTRPVSLLLDRVGEIFNDGISEEPLTHLPKLRFDVVPVLPTVR